MVTILRQARNTTDHIDLPLQENSHLAGTGAHPQCGLHPGTSTVSDIGRSTHTRKARGTGMLAQIVMMTDLTIWKQQQKLL